jgi:hypothetical protein
MIKGVDAFLSHNRADKEVARQIGAQLPCSARTCGFDDWEVRAGDSLPGKVKDWRLYAAKVGWGSDVLGRDEFAAKVPQQ